MAALNGSKLRTLINDEEIRHERCVAFEPEDIRITLLAQVDDDTYNKWLKRKGEKVNFKIATTDINLDVVITNVILKYQNEAVVEIELRLQ